MTRQTNLIQVAWLAGFGLVCCGCAESGGAGIARGPAARLEQDYGQKIDALLPGMGAADPMARKDPQLALEKMCFEASGPGKEAERRAICMAMMARVGPETAKPARIWILRKVEPLGRDEVVPRLAALLHDADADVRETARRALTNNPSPRAAEALRKELARAADNAWRIACINALGWRHDAASVPALIPLAASPDAGVACAAASALGSVGNEAAVKALAGLRKTAGPAVRSTVLDASLRAAERIAAAGKPDVAATICRELMIPGEPEPVRLAAVCTFAKTQGEKALPLLISMISGNDVHLQLTAADCARRIPGRAVTEKLAAAMDAAPPDVQVVLLDTLGRRGCPVALPAVVARVKHDNAEVRAAAVAALQFLGNASTVNLLAERAAKADGDEKDAARNALAALRGADVDGVILKAIDNAEPSVREELVRAAALRHIAAARELFYPATASADEGTRVAALKALGRFASTDEYGKLITILAKSPGGRTTRVAEETVEAVGKRIQDPDKRVEPVIAAMREAPAPEKVRLIHMLKRYEGRLALTAIREAGKSDDKAVRDAALEALSQWSSLFVDQWVLSGPYAEDGKNHTDLFEIAFAPEKAPADAKWSPLKDKFEKQPGLFELNKVARNKENCCAYVRTRIWSEKEQKAQLAFGSDDGIKVWFNGNVVHANNASRACKCDEDKVTVTLKEGWNDLMLKITQGGGDWSFCCGIKAPDGGPIDGLQFEAK